MLLPLTLALVQSPKDLTQVDAIDRAGPLEGKRVGKRRQCNIDSDEPSAKKPRISTSSSGRDNVASHFKVFCQRVDQKRT